VISLRERNKLQEVKNKMSRKITTPNTDEASEEFKALYNQEFRDFLRLPGIVRAVASRNLG
jgi:hypothetical protein